MVSVRPRRSILYVPASRPGALDKARTLGADGYIFDLEDSVAPSLKDSARADLVKALTRGGYGKAELVVRINAVETPWHADDLAAVADLPIDALLLPKVSSARVLHESAQIYTGPLWCMIESARAVLNLAAIVDAHPHLTCLVAGCNDLAQDLCATPDPPRTALLSALSQMVYAARAAGLGVIDGVYGRVGDIAGVEDHCQQSRSLGFDGTTLIHPEQIAPANHIFAPSSSQIVQAQSIIEAYNAAIDKGVIVVGGQMIEAVHVAMARRTLAIEKAIKG